MDKSADAFRTISEVAEHLETPAHVLRFWESRFPQIRPVKRAGGRRYYRPSDVALLTGIKRLLHDEGLTIRGVQKILREQGVRHVSGLSVDAADVDILDETAYSVQLDNADLPVEAEPTRVRPAPGLAEAMAKAVDYRPSDAKSDAPNTISPIPQPDDVEVAKIQPSPAESSPVKVVRAEPASGVITPAQGALLLTPLARGDAGAAGRGSPSDITISTDRGSASLVEASPQDMAEPADSAAETLGLSSAAFPETPHDTADFDDDDFDQGPSYTLASRIRALPHGASAGKVGNELLSVVARLQTLRDAVADAAQTGRA